MSKLTWFKRIKAAEKRGKFLLKDKLAAHNWSTCLIGEKLGIENRGGLEDLKPIFEIYGTMFESHVYDDDISGAKIIYNDVRKELSK